MRTKIGRLAIALAVAAGLVLSASAALADTFGVAATSGNRWKPAHRYISKSDRVRWRNPTGRRHTIRSYGGNWSYFKGLPSGGARTRQFTRTGTFRYRCTLHSTMNNGACSGMCGIIHVFSG